MEVFLGSYFIIQIITLFIWGYSMFFMKSELNRGKNTFMSNWKEGGNKGLVMNIVFSLSLSFIIGLVNWMLTF